MTVSPNRPYIPALDHLRAGAALLIIFYHGLHIFGSALIYNAPSDPWKHWIRAANPFFAVLVEGHTAVGLFIVLSGFVLSVGLINHDFSYRQFLLSRVLRIYPLYIVLLVYAVHSSSGATLTTLIASLLPTSNIPAAGAVNGSLGAMFWSVSIEFQCYLIFPFLLRFADRQGVSYLWGVIALSVVMSFLAALSTGTDPQPLAYSTIAGRLSQFCLGMIAAYAYTAPRRPVSGSGLAMAGAGALVVLTLWGFNQLGGFPSRALWKLVWPVVEGGIWAWFILTYIAFSTKMPGAVAALLKKAGEISYSLYLIHFAVMFAMVRHKWLIAATGNGYVDALITTALVALPVTLAISAMTYHFVEKPFLLRRPRYVSPSPPA